MAVGGIYLPRGAFVIFGTQMLRTEMPIAKDTLATLTHRWTVAFDDTAIPHFR